MDKVDLASALAEPYGSYFDIIGRNARVLGDSPALRDDAGELSWADLGDKVERIAAKLVEEGLEKGQAHRLASVLAHTAL